MTGLGTIFRIFAAAIALATMLASPALARALNGAEKSALPSTVSKFDGAMKSKNVDHISQTVPPKIFKVLAKKTNVEEVKIREAMLDLLKSTMDEIPLEAFSMDVTQAEFKETPKGSPYALIPTKVSIALEGQRFDIPTHTLALLDGQTWYRVRVSEEQQIALLREAYPDFVAEDFPKSTTETQK